MYSHFKPTGVLPFSFAKANTWPKTNKNNTYNLTLLFLINMVYNFVILKTAYGDNIHRTLLSYLFQTNSDSFTSSEFVPTYTLNFPDSQSHRRSLLKNLRSSVVIEKVISFDSPGFKNTFLNFFNSFTGRTIDATGSLTYS